MPGSERFGIDPIWQRIILPATALLRLSILAAVVGGRFFHLEIDPGVRVVAGVAAVLYAMAYAAAWSGRLKGETLAYTCLIDAALLGGLTAAAGPHTWWSGLLCMLSLSIAYLCGGWRITAASLVAMAAGGGIALAAGLTDLIAGGTWGTRPFRLLLEAETTYRGNAAVAFSSHQIVRAALLTFLAVGLGGLLVFARASWERRRVAQACAEVDALEALVDCYTSDASDAELWETVSRSASILSGADVVCARAETDAIELLSTDAPSAGSLPATRIPLAAEANAIVRSVMSGREAETNDVEDLYRGADDGAAPTARRSDRFVIVPLRGDGVRGALVATVRGKGGPGVLEGLRLAAERTGLVLRARAAQRARLELQPSAGA